MRFVAVLIVAMIILSACGTPEQPMGPVGNLQRPAYPYPVAAANPAPGAPLVVPPVSARPAVRDRYAAPCPYYEPTPVSTEYAQQATAYALTPIPTVNPNGYPPPLPTPECPTPALNPSGMQATQSITPTFIVDSRFNGYPAPQLSAVRPSRLIRFFDASNGLGIIDDNSRQTLVRTTDGGRSWTHVSALPATCAIENIEFINAQRGWIFARSQQLPEGPRSLCRTTDGDITWTVVSTLDQFPYGATLSFVDEQTGYIAGLHQLWKTENSGTTFAPIGRAAATPDMIDFVSPQVGWGVDNDQLFSTNDGGQSWKQLSLGYRVKFVELLSDKQGWVGADNCTGRSCDYILLYTGDAGATWTRFATSDRNGNGLGNYSPLVFADPLHGWVGNETSLWSTSDGGRTWTRLY